MRLISNLPSLVIRTEIGVYL